MADSATGRFELDPNQLSSQVISILMPRAESLTRRIAAEGAARAPVRTGNLGRTIRPEPIVQAGPFLLTTGVTAGAPYAAAVHEGTRPHVIRPKNGQFLKFEMGGRTIFAREVHHPGTRARPFLREAAEYIVGQE